MLCIEACRFNSHFEYSLKLTSQQSFNFNSLKQNLCSLLYISMSVNLKYSIVSQTCTYGNQKKTSYFYKKKLQEPLILIQTLQIYKI